MKKTVKAITAIFVILSVAFGLICQASAEGETNLNLDCKSAILIEASTGAVLYEQNADAPLPPASVTKVMTLLLVMEAIDNNTIKLTDTMQASEYAASMGGSQIFIEPNEIMTVEDLLKSVVIASANDAAVVLAEGVCGSVEHFVERMNQRAKELGMKNTTFENPTGLDDNTVNHLTSARDIAIMSAELIKHDSVLEYTKIWMDTVRNGQFGLTNTNRLIRYYNGANGLKTGSTSKAKFCISASAKRDDMQLIAVIMGAPTRDIRNDCAKKLLDYGFANFSLARFFGGEYGSVKIVGGKDDSASIYTPDISFVVKKGKTKDIVQSIDLPDSIQAPVKAGNKIGEIIYKLDGQELGRSNVTAGQTVEKITYWGIIKELMKKMLLI